MPAATHLQPAPLQPSNVIERNPIRRITNRGNYSILSKVKANQLEDELISEPFAQSSDLRIRPAYASDFPLLPHQGGDRPRERPRADRSLTYFHPTAARP